MTPRYVWVASYPKSGNTWVRFLLTNLLAGPVERSAAIERFCPDLHHGEPAASAPVYRGATFLKTHWVAPFLGDRLKQTAGAVYVVRNPLDVCCSALHYLVKGGAGRAAEIRSFAACLGIEEWRTRAMGTIPANIASWFLARPRFPRLVLRYEDLAQAPHETAARLCWFLGRPATETQIAEAVERSSFAALAALEEGERARGADGFFAGFEPGVPGWRFMNRGQAGGFREVMADEEIDLVAGAFREVMDEFGYGVDGERRLTVAARYPAERRLIRAAAFS